MALGPFIFLLTFLIGCKTFLLYLLLRFYYSLLQLLFSQIEVSIFLNSLI